MNADDAAELIIKRFEKLNEKYARIIGARVKAIGRVSATDFYRLRQLRDIGADMEALKKAIAKEAGVTLKQLEPLMRKAAKESMEPYDLSQAERYAFSPRAEALAAAQYQVTAKAMENLSNTTAVEKAYRDLIDRAVTEVQAGTMDYQGAMRTALKQAAANGIPAVEYESGHVRRLDSAVRQNILDGFRDLTDAVREDVGTAMGADGVEISAHMLCAEDHLPYQGRQYTKAQFQQIQDSLARPFGMWNCRHTVYPVILGTSKPAYTSAELKQFEQQSREKVTVEGVTKTRYEWTQWQRKCETDVRRLKNAANAAAAAGDDALRRECQGKINELQKAYSLVSAEAGLEPQKERMSVSGFRSVKPVAEQQGPKEAQRKLRELVNANPDVLVRDPGREWIVKATLRKEVDTIIDELTPCLRRNSD